MITQKQKTNYIVSTDNPSTSRVPHMKVEVDESNGTLSLTYVGINRDEFKTPEEIKLIANLMLEAAKLA